MRFVRKLVTGSRQLGKPLPHLLLLAPSGNGKTVLAESLAAAIGTELHSVFGAEQVRPFDLHMRLQEMNFADLLLLDEAQSLKPDSQQALYLAVDRNIIPAYDEKGRPNNTTKSIAEFTLVLATNYPGRVLKALRNRVTELQFERYSEGELIAIARRIAQQQDITLSPQAARQVAQVAQGTPRRVHQHMSNLAIHTHGATEYDLAMVRKYLESIGVDKYGLTTTQRDYLRTLAAMPNQRAALNHVAARLGLDVRFIREEVEYYLLEQGYVEILSTSARRLVPKVAELLAKRVS